MLKKIAIIGRPNVGKSTLFNRLAGKKLALIDDRPGVTRDWKETPAQLGDLRFNIIDTAGLEGFEAEEIFQQILKQTEKVIAQADVILFVIDGIEGVIPSDQRLAEKLRRTQKPVILLVNKAENVQKAIGVAESHKLGLGEPLPISAAHGEGLYELYQALAPYVADEESDEEIAEEEELLEEQDKEIPPLSLVVVGRPNAGKSTFINHLLGEERLIASDQPGITRDAVSIDWSWQGKPIRLVDTAGIRRRARVEDQLEKASVSDALRAVRFAHVVILMVDARSPLDKQDLLIASKVIEEGRCLVIGLNKWDIADPKILKDVQYTLENSLSQVKGLPCIPISAKQGRNVDKLLQAVFDVYAQWNRRLSTGKLNQWLEGALERHPAPISGAGRVRLKYMTQIKTRPPTFVIFASKPLELPDSYIRYLTTSLRQQFDLYGIPLRLYLRKGKNPYADNSD